MNKVIYLASRLCGQEPFMRKSGNICAEIAAVPEHDAFPKKRERAVRKPVWRYKRLHPCPGIPYKAFRLLAAPITAGQTYTDWCLTLDYLSKCLRRDAS